MPRPVKSARRRPWIRWALIAGALFVVYQVFSGPRGVLKIADLRAQNAALARQIDSLEARKAELLAEKNRLLHDSAHIEKVARRELGMARPGEKVYRLVAPAGRDTATGR